MYVFLFTFLQFRCRSFSPWWSLAFLISSLSFSSNEIGLLCFHVIHVNVRIKNKSKERIGYRKIPKISPGAYIFQRPFLVYCTTIMSFPCTVLLSNIVLNQPAREESLIYCKNWLIDSLVSDFLSPNKHTIRCRLVLVSATNT